MNRPRCLNVAVGLVTIGLVTVAQAQIWFELGDAPVRPAMQGTIGIGPLIEIIGSGGTDAQGLIDVDFYLVRVVGGEWSASTLGGANWNTMLALYEMDGLTQIAANDDAGETLQSFIGGNLPSGCYSLGITRHADFGFDDTGSYGLDPYTISLTGMAYCPYVPAEPASLAMLVLGGLVLIRRR